jgi:hypothetical protein
MWSLGPWIFPDLGIMVTLCTLFTKYIKIEELLDYKEDSQYTCQGYSSLTASDLARC